MLQFHVELCYSGSNPGGCSNSYTGYYTPQAHKVRRYIHLFVASEGVINTKRSITPPKELACPVEFYSTGVSDVLAFILARTHVASTNTKLFMKEGGEMGKNRVWIRYFVESKGRGPFQHCMRVEMPWFAFS